MDLVYFELNNWFSGRDYPNDQTFERWVLDYKFSDDAWCKENELVVTAGHYDMSMNWCITAPKNWVDKNCPQLLTDKSFKYYEYTHSAAGEKKEEYTQSYSEFLRQPNNNGEVFGMFGWKFLEYAPENFGVHWHCDEDQDGEEEEEEKPKKN